ncbi:MAG: hypothetical protein FVQ81_03060 [Candidatus Glassbacteria bacterium]|nr:hypothetical protein [Candidatus Glassbacteria bacterium]
MADNETDNTAAEEPVEADGEDTIDGGGESPEEADAPPAGKGGGLLASLRGQNLKVLLAFPAAGVLAAAVIGFLIFGGGGEAEPEQEATRETSTPLIMTTRVREIAEFRSKLRRSNRSSRNQHLRKRLGEDDLYRIAVRGELALISGMFDHYVNTTARFYELFRIMANEYVEQPSQLKEIFEKELLPDYNATERRRRMLRRRVEHDPAVELYNRLDYIAYHDSIAVQSFHEFLIDGGAQKFATTSDLVSESKFMITDFRTRLQARLRDFDMTYEISENMWDRYYGAWPW